MKLWQLNTLSTFLQNLILSNQSNEITNQSSLFFTQTVYVLLCIATFHGFLSYLSFSVKSLFPSPRCEFSIFHFPEQTLMLFCDNYNTVYFSLQIYEILSSFEFDSVYICTLFKAKSSSNNFVPTSSKFCKLCICLRLIKRLWRGLSSRGISLEWCCSSLHTVCIAVNIYWLVRVVAPVSLNITEEGAIDSEETEFVISSDGDSFMESFETSNNENLNFIACIELILWIIFQFPPERTEKATLK